jgi:hypothetical protein
MRQRTSARAMGLVVTAMMLLLPAIARGDGSAGPVYYSNGDVATATKECDTGEVCATISEASGDQLKVLTGSSGRCNPYVLTFMRYAKDQLMAVWATPTDRNPDSSGMMGAKCGGFRNTHMTVDGVIDMGVFQNTDGKVFVTFFGGSTTPPATPSPAPAASPAPSPSPAPKRSSLRQLGQ